MATVGGHGVSAFTSPSNGDALDATVVKGNDNTLRTAYVAHDNDAGIHVQSSTLATRPVAGTAGRFWVTTDTGSIKQWYDNGSSWEEVAYVPSTGAVTLTSDLTVQGNTTLGNATTDTVTVTAGVNSSVLPSTTNSVDLGSTTQRWRDVFAAGTINTSNTVSAATVSATTVSGTNVTGASLTASSGNVAVTAGNLTFGAASAKIIPGATSLLVRDTADANTNLSVTDAGALTVRNGLTVSANGAGITGATSVSGAKTTLAATATGYASLNLPHGTAPTSPVNGDVWTTSAGIFTRINGSTVGPLIATPTIDAFIGFSQVTPGTGTVTSTFSWSQQSQTGSLWAGGTPTRITLTAGSTYFINVMVKSSAGFAGTEYLTFRGDGGTTAAFDIINVNSLNIDMYGTVATYWFGWSTVTARGGSSTYFDVQITTNATQTVDAQIIIRRVL